MSDAWFIQPNGPLVGDVQVHGSKNAVTKHMVAALLGEGPSTIANVPEVGDVEITAGILRAIGAGVDQEDGKLEITPPEEAKPEVPLSFSGLNRIPVLLLGPLLHLTGEAFVPLVGGDRIGGRPVDFHVQALEALGAEVEVTDEGIRARCRRLRGRHHRASLPERGGDRVGPALGGVGGGQDRHPQRRHRARGPRAGPVPPAHGGPGRAVPGPAHGHRRRASVYAVLRPGCRATATRPSRTWWPA